jgi:two-component system, NarL family, sensor kinase
MKILILLGIAAMMALSIGIILFVIMYQRRIIRHQLEIKAINDQKQQELINASLKGEEEERMRIASELHDDVGATLSSVRLFLHTAARTPEDVTILEQSRELLDDSIQKIRNISHKLQPSTLEHLGLHTSLQSHADLISRSGSLKFQYSSSVELPRLADNIEMAVYRIIQELTNNIIKHSHATDIHLKTVYNSGTLSIFLSHNGEGLTEEHYQEMIYKKGAIGLKNIVNRLKSINANIQFEKAGEQNYQIAISIPVNT